MQNDEDAIRALIEAWMQGTRDGDVDAVTALMADDAVFLSSGQPPMTGRAAFADGMRQWMGAMLIEPSSRIEEIVVSGDLAYCRSELTIVMTPKDGKPPMRRSGHTLSILRKGADGAWLLTRDANLLGAPS